MHSPQTRESERSSGASSGEWRERSREVESLRTRNGERDEEGEATQHVSIAKRACGCLQC